MSRQRMQTIERKRDGFFPMPDLGLSWNLQDVFYPPGGLFASVGQMGVGFGVSPNPLNPNPDPKDNVITDLYAKYVSPEFGFGVVGSPTDTAVEAAEQVLEEAKPRKKKKAGLKLKIRIGNPHFRRLFSGAIAGAVSRTAVAPLETIRTHLMVGSNGNSTTEVFHSIIRTEGWKGLFRGNFVNVIRVAPSKAIEFSVAGWVQCSLDFNDPMPHGVLEYAHAIHRSKASKAMLSCISMHDPRDHAALDHQTLFAYDTAKNILTSKMGEPPKLPVPSSLVAGAFAGVSSTLCTYPLELLKTRLTIQRDAYDNLLHAFIKILREEGPAELYRGLTPSLIGVVPYAATNYFAYETLKKLYRKTFKEEEIGNFATLLIGSAAGAISSSATFPLEVARKHMQVGAVGSRQVYRNMLHALVSILENEGIGGLYKGLGPSCMKLVPAAGISFMCYEACKKILIDKEDDV